MSAFGTAVVYSRGDDWLIASIAVFVAYLIIYPIYIYLLRNKHSRRIKSHLVTSAYKLPVNLTPTELAYIFSAKVGRNQLYATLLDLANRSLLILDKDDKSTLVEIGPKVDEDLREYEELLINKIKFSDRPLTVNKVIEGVASYDLEKGNKITGTKSYVYWWLQRENMRKRKIIEKSMMTKYSFMLFKFGVLAGLLVSVVPLTIYRFVQMLDSGEVDVDGLIRSAQSGFLYWVMALIPLLALSFFLLRFRGRMLGRAWLLTPGFKRYLGQLDAFREYVRLTHKNKLRFESKELKQESTAHTRPYAIACGYVKPQTPGK